MPNSCSLLPPPKRRRHGRRFRKRAAELNSAATAVAVSGGPGFLSASPAGFLSAGLAGFFEPAAAASTLGGNSVRNRVEFRNLG